MWELTALDGQLSGATSILAPAPDESYISPKTGEIWGTRGSWARDIPETSTFLKTAAAPKSVF
jgi:hypothetical protein